MAKSDVSVVMVNRYAGLRIYRMGVDTMQVLKWSKAS